MNDDWIARWRDGRTGFHEDRPNEHLAHHVDWLGGARRVLVPLCGKAVDLGFLATHGHEVVGIELAEQAVGEFFAEHSLTPTIGARGPFVEYRAGAITLLAGDVFDATPELLGPIDALYDRAALIALPADIRPRYVAHLRALLPAGAPGLVITLDYDQARIAGPPYAVSEAELRALYAGAAIELLAQQQASDLPKCSQAGVSVVERCFAIQCDDPRS